MLNSTDHEDIKYYIEKMDSIVRRERSSSSKGTAWTLVAAGAVAVALIANPLPAAVLFTYVKGGAGLIAVGTSIVKVWKWKPSATQKGEKAK